MTTVSHGFGSTSEIIECQRILFQRHVECRGWGGELNRQTLDIEEDKCRLQIDLTYRLVRMTPNNGRQPFETTLEAVQQYFRKVEIEEKAAEPQEPRHRGWPKGKPRKSLDTETSIDQ